MYVLKQTLPYFTVLSVCIKVSSSKVDFISNVDKPESLVLPNLTITTVQSGLEPTVRLVRFGPDHFLLGACSLLVNAWDWHLQQNRSNEMLWL